MRKRLALGILLAVVCLCIAFRGISVKATLAALLHADPRWALAAVGIYFLGFVARAMRWRILVRPLKDVPTSQLFHLLVIGLFANNVLPFRIGELVRADLTGRKFKISRSGSLGTIFLERVFDMLAFLTTFVLSAFFFSFPGQIKKAAELMALGCLLAIVGIVGMVLKREWFEAGLIIVPLPERLKARALRFLGNFTHGMAGMLRPRYVAATMALSLIAWTIEGTVLYLLAHSLLLPLTFPEAFFLLFFMGVAVTIPGAPGYVGTLEAFGRKALTALGYGSQQSVSVVVAIHGFQFVFILLLGFWSLSREGLSFKSITRSGEAAI